MKDMICPEGLYKPVLELFVDLFLRVKGYQAELEASRCILWFAIDAQYFP